MSILSLKIFRVKIKIKDGGIFMNKEAQLGLLFSNLANELNISATLYDRAVTSYTALGDYIRKNNEDWEIEVFPHGSFELGTVVKPVSDEDNYDVDLVVLIRTPKFENPQHLRNVIKKFLESHGRYEGNIEEKKQCLRVVYSDSAQFHMDIACARTAYYGGNNIIEIAKRNEADRGYNFSLSNPRGYIDWFKKAMNFDRLMQEAHHRTKMEASTKVEKLSLPTLRTPLQKAIQILKRHRDIFFQDNLDAKPSSIIITTLCALCYDNAQIYQSERANVYITIKTMLDNFQLFLCSDNKGQYKLSNPSFEEENFLYKWNTDDELRKKFYEWINKAKIDIVQDPFNFLDRDPKRLRHIMFESFGERSVQSAYDAYGKEMEKLNESGQLYIDRKSMSSTTCRDENTVKPKQNTFYGH